VKRAAILSLGRIGKGTTKVEEALQGFVNDPDPEIRLDAVVASATLGKVDDSAIPTLIAAMGSKNETTAKAAGLALTEIGHEHPQKIVPGLVEILKRPEDPAVLQAVNALGRMKGQSVEALPYLAALYDHAPPQHRPQMLDALVTIDLKGQYAIPALVKTLDDPDPNLRREALIGLLRFRSETDAIIDPVIKAFRDSLEENRLLAVNIVRGLGPKGAPALPALVELGNDPYWQVRKVAIDTVAALNGTSQDVTNMLASKIGDEELRVRMAAVQALRRLGLTHPDEAAVLLRHALEKEPNENAKRSIAAALRSIIPNTPPAPTSGPENYGGAAKQEEHPPQKAN
jgi:HEAT repeat protein